MNHSNHCNLTVVRGRSRVVDRGGFVSGCWGRFVGIVVGFTRVLNVSDIPRVVISNVVSHSLGAAIG